MHRLVIEVDAQLFSQLARAAKAGHITVEAECLQRLQGAERHSRYLQALLADLRADEQQRRASSSDQVA